MSAPIAHQLYHLFLHCVWKKTEIDCQCVIKFITCYKIFMVFIFTFYGMLKNQFQFIVDEKKIKQCI